MSTFRGSGPTYKACDVDNAPTYIEGFGWRLADMLYDHHRDLTTPVKETDGYRPGIIMRKHVEGRDGTCRMSGCDEPAYYTQLDHRHNYADGGATHPDNLACLCQKHHNLKTDGSAYYLLDPATGDIIWLYDNGTWAVTEAQGPLAPREKRWAQTIGQHITTTRQRTREQAQQLKQELDDYHAEQQTTAQAETESHANTTEDIPF